MSNRLERESVILQSTAAVERGLRAIFDWRGDRYGHRIEMMESGRERVLLNSYEGVAVDNWPSSPPLQQLHLEERQAGQQVVLLVGMSDKEHWSASVEVDATGETLTFDIACRVSTPNIPLRSTYEVDKTVGPNWILEPLDCDGQMSNVVHDGNRIAVTPPPSSVRTVRWKYRIVLS